MHFTVFLALIAAEPHQRERAPPPALVRDDGTPALPPAGPERRPDVAVLSGTAGGERPRRGTFRCMLRERRRPASCAGRFFWHGRGRCR